MAMRVFVPINNKGGTGKTTVCQTAAHYYAKQDIPVCLIDLDPQSMLSRRFLEMEETYDDDGDKVVRPPVHPEFDPSDPIWRDTAPDGRDSTANLFYYGNQASYDTAYKNISIYPAESKLINVERITLQKAVNEAYYQIQHILQNDYFHENFEIVIIDTGPSKGPLTAAAVHAATDVIIPTLMENMGIEGLDGMLQMIERVNLTRADDNRVNIVGILGTRVKKNSKLHQYYYGGLRENEVTGPMLLETVMHDWQPYTEMSMDDGKPVFDLPQSSDAHKEAIQLMQEIESRMRRLA